MLDHFLSQYGKNRRPISVSFRNLIDILPSPHRTTHLIHSYPAKLLMHIPYFFLSNTILSQPGDTVLDPFCGSGTVLLESMLAGRNAIGVDVNPLARLISKVKTTPLDIKKLDGCITRLWARIPNESTLDQPDVINLNYWFYPHVVQKLLRILEGIKSTRDRDIKDFFLVCFSSCARRVSLADPRLSVPVRLRNDQYQQGHWLYEKTDKLLKRLRRINVLTEFNKIVETNKTRIASLNSKGFDGVVAQVVGVDAKDLRFDLDQNGQRGRKIPSNSVDLIITSPPYIGAQKYIRASSLSLGWLDLCESQQLRELDAQSIGREHFSKQTYLESVNTGIKSADKVLKSLHTVNPLRGRITGAYILEMRETLKEIARVLKPNGYMVLVAANNQVCGQEFRTQHYLREITEEFGLTLILRLVDDIRSRGLMTKRNKTASVITREWVLLFQKSKGGYGRTN
ncbi:MAG TPA: DNA methyltransferase [Pyrinomonadaceae bacterium]|jgi:SAM-dependent methyltransferase